jgi:RNA polymerase sigma-70 factor (ECF subfamily)
LTALCCGDASLADDIAQESYIKAYLSCDGFRDASSFNAWIYRIAYNTFISHRRSCRPTGSLEDAATVAAPDRADANFKYQALYAAMAKLSERERTAVLLFYLQGYSVKEIAAVIDASEDAVKQQLSRGRAHLRTIMNSETF